MIDQYLVLIQVFTHLQIILTIMDNGNDPPARTSNLEFSDEKQKTIK